MKALGGDREGESMGLAVGDAVGNNGCLVEINELTRARELPLLLESLVLQADGGVTAEGGGVAMLG